MAKIHLSANAKQLEAEAKVVHETNRGDAWEEQDRKSRTRLVVIHSLLILVSAGLVLFVLLGPGVLEGILSGVKETLKLWRDRLDDYLLMPKDPERPDNALGTVWLGILLALDWVVRTVGKLLLPVLSWCSPVLILGGLLGAAFLVVRHSILVIGDNRGPREKKEDIKDKAIHALDEDMARDYRDAQSQHKALELVMDLSDDCHIFTNLTLQHNDLQAQADMIVVSPSGVTVVDVRSETGLLFGDLSEKKLYQWKYEDLGPGKKKQSKEAVPNPVKLLGKPILVLTQLLWAQGVKLEVEGCVLFAEEKLQLHTTDHRESGASCPVFLASQQEALLEYLGGRRVGGLNRNTIQQVVEILENIK